MASKNLTALTSASSLGGTELAYVVQSSNSRKTTATAIANTADAWQPVNANLTTLAGLAKTDSNFIVGNGTAWVAESGATVRTSLGLTIGTDVQAYSANLASWSAVAPSAYLTVANDLSDVADAATARSNIGAQQDVQYTVSLELGNLVSGDRVSLIDLHASDSVDYSARLVRDPGVNGDLQIAQTGTGDIDLTGGSDLRRSGNPILHTGAQTLTSGQQTQARANIGASGLSSGSVVQSVWSTPYTTHGAITTIIPNDDTIPQNTEGTQVLSATITPTSAANKLRIRAIFNATPTGAGETLVGTICKSDVANALGVGSVFAGDGVMQAFPVEAEYALSSTSPVTIHGRVGIGNSGTIYTNGGLSGRFFGGVQAMTLVVEEIKA